MSAEAWEAALRALVEAVLPILVGMTAGWMLHAEVHAALRRRKRAREAATGCLPGTRVRAPHGVDGGALRGLIEDTDLAWSDGSWTIHAHGDHVDIALTEDVLGR